MQTVAEYQIAKIKQAHAELKDSNDLAEYKALERSFPGLRDAKNQIERLVQIIKGTQND